MNQSSWLGTSGENTFQFLWEDGERVFYRMYRRENKTTVLAMRPAGEISAAAALDRLAHEFGLKDVLESAWAVRPLELVHQGGQSMLLFQDTGGEPLNRLLGAPMEVGRFLRLAIGISAALGRAHKHGVIHRDLKPANVLVNCVHKEVRLTGFGIASRLPRERQEPGPPETIAGTLAYMAPEQTGRMNRSVDARSDLYSLGVTLYQMLTGSLPFAAIGLTRRRSICSRTC